MFYKTSKFKYTGKSLIVLLLLAFLANCRSNTPENHMDEVETRNKEAREDSAKLASAYRAQSAIEQVVYPAVETIPVNEDSMTDAADDPAIWYCAHTPEKSLVFGTNKKKGVHAYSLDGKEQQFYPYGKVNNIDVRQNVTLSDRTVDILGGSNRSDNSIILQGIDSVGNLYNLMPQNFRIDTADIDEVYGFCLYKDQNNIGYAIVNGKNGKINQYVIRESDNMAKPELVNSWQLNSQPEGMVADDETGDLYIGEEEKGIWKLSLTDPEKPLVILPDSQKENNSAIEYDIEGLAIFHGTDEIPGFLLASIQGSFTYAMFDRTDNRYLGSFKISGSETIDGVEETDGLDISSAAFNDTFPNGMLVVQDGFNYTGSTMAGQNFKLIKLSDIPDLRDTFE